MDKTESQKEAKRFLSQGVRGGLSEEELALACDQQVQIAARQSFKAGLSIAEKLADRTQGCDGPLRLTAIRCLARMNHFSGVHKKALEFYLQARKLARSLPLIRGRIDRTLIDVYMYLNNFGASRLAARRALATFTKLKADSDLAQTRANYGNLLHRQDRHQEAEKQYREAASYFETTDNKVALARCYYNRANTLVQMFDMEEAEALYVRAGQMYEAEGFTLDACDVRYGLAWLWMLNGAYHKALVELEQCRNQYHEAGDLRGVALCLLDRSEVYLGLALYRDAYDSARIAEKKFSRLNLRYEHAKASLFRGQAALALGKRCEAVRAMNQAKAEFALERNIGFSGVVGLLTADLSTSLSDRNRELRGARRNFARSRLAYWEAVCDYKELRAGRLIKTNLKRLSQNPAVSQVPHLYALWQTLNGDYEFSRGNKSGARKSWRQAADRLDEVCAQLPPLELRTAYSCKHVSPHTRLIADAIDHSPQMAAVWSERMKTAGVWAPITWDHEDSGQRDRVSASLGELASRVAALAHQISPQPDTTGNRGKSAVRTMRGLQTKIREELLVVETGRARGLQPSGKLAASFRTISREMPIVQFHLQDHDIIAFVHQREQTRVMRFTGGRERLSISSQRWRFLLESELMAAPRYRQDATTAEQVLWDDLGQWLWTPLRVDPKAEKVLIIPEGELANLPWSALRCEGTALIERHAFIHTPSLRHFLEARRKVSLSRQVEIFRGSSDGLPSMAKETAHLEKQAGKNVSIHDPCLRDDWPLASDADIWHYSGHAVMKEDNPFYSYLSLENGPLFAADFRIRDCNVNLVTLAACRAGEQVALPGEEATGLVRSLLEMGARNVIAGYWPVANESTSLWMQTFYDGYFRKCCILQASRQAALAVRKQYGSAYHWAAFGVSGAGDIRR